MVSEEKEKPIVYNLIFLYDVFAERETNNWVTVLLYKEVVLKLPLHW